MTTTPDKLAAALRAMESHMSRVHEGFNADETVRAQARAALAEYDAEKAAAATRKASRERRRAIGERILSHGSTDGARYIACRCAECEAGRAELREGPR